jgi:hypothetical protein
VVRCAAKELGITGKGSIPLVYKKILPLQYLAGKSKRNTSITKRDPSDRSGITTFVLNVCLKTGKTLTMSGIIPSLASSQCAKSVKAPEVRTFPKKISDEDELKKLKIFFIISTLMLYLADKVHKEHELSQHISDTQKVFREPSAKQSKKNFVF